MSNRILQTIAIGATSVALIGGLAGMAGATPTAPEAVAAAPSHNATATPSPTRPCQKDKDCKSGYKAGHKAGKNSCKSSTSGTQTPSGSAEYRRGFELGYQHARARYC
ncbi:hypothetical protein [Streptosporangium amethystogenes]|uniref:hypothetical protein n=1 Tax=Streptosporangium amethystogenes TaxID=2002 RepID=UPI0012F827EC|nr:hypothetical protein [Streptosporangium amethystogenes]